MLSFEVIEYFNRLRLTNALAEECLDNGYRRTTITGVAVRAHTSRVTVYKHFAGKEAMFLGLLERVLAELSERVELACAGNDKSSDARIVAGLDAVLSWVAADPAGAHALLVEAPGVSPRAFQIQFDARDTFVERLRASVRSDAPRPDRNEQMLVDGVASVLRRLLVAGEAERAPDLVWNLSTFLASQPCLDDLSS